MFVLGRRRRRLTSSVKDSRINTNDSIRVFESFAVQTNCDVYTYPPPKRDAGRLLFANQQLQRAETGVDEDFVKTKVMESAPVYAEDTIYAAIIVPSKGKFNVWIKKT